MGAGPVDEVVEAAGPDRALEAALAAIGRFDVDAAVAHLSAAIRGFTAAGLPCRAAMACAHLGEVYANAMGNLTGARAWFLRAERLVADQPPCLEQGWVALAAMGCDVDDPADLLARADLALDRARRFGDVNLEAKALADGGLALVRAGQLADGMRRLDEAMALVCGPADDLDAAGKSVCSFFTACYHVADFERAGSWAEVLRRHGLIGGAGVVPAFLGSHCDSVQAAALVECGRWSEAEEVLTRAMAEFEARTGAPSWHPAIGLAELRILQGRLADAEALLLGRDASLEALVPLARLHLARGDHALARATATRGLRAMAGDRLRAGALLSVVVEAELATGDVAAAGRAAADLTARVADLDLPALRARARSAAAAVRAADGDLPGARALLEEAVDALAGTAATWLRAVLQVRLAEVHERAGDVASASVEAGVAAAELARLDVVVPPHDRATLERLGAHAGGTGPGAPTGAAGGPAAPTGTGAATALLIRAERGWLVRCGGTAAPLRDSKGLRYLALLLDSPGVERHVLDLVDRVEGVVGAGDAPIDRRRLGDAGELLDGRARTAYRHRIEQLRSEVDEALADGAEHRAGALQDELDQLVGELARAFGLGGRSRPAASAAEKARLNVTRALRTAVDRLVEVLPDAGAQLDRRIRTGRYCAYEPAEDDPFRWIVQPAMNGTAPG